MFWVQRGKAVREGLEIGRVQMAFIRNQLRLAWIIFKMKRFVSKSVAVALVVNIHRRDFSTQEFSDPQNIIRIPFRFIFLAQSLSY